MDRNYDRIEAGVVWTVGALFDYVAGRMPRAPHWIADNGLEWIFRLVVEPRRMWRRYLLGNPAFLYRVLSERRAGCTPPGMTRSLCRPAASPVVHGGRDPGRPCLLALVRTGVQKAGVDGLVDHGGRRSGCWRPRCSCSAPAGSASTRIALPAALRRHELALGAPGGGLHVHARLTASRLRAGARSGWRCPGHRAPGWRSRSTRRAAAAPGGPGAPSCVWPAYLGALVACVGARPVLRGRLRHGDRRGLRCAPGGGNRRAAPAHVTRPRSTIGARWTDAGALALQATHLLRAGGGGHAVRAWRPGRPWRRWSR